MNINKFYYLLSSLLAFLAAFIYFSPVVVTPDFIYPTRIDSTYVSLYASTHAKEPQDPANGYDEIQGHYNPSSLGIEYSDFQVKTLD
nr:hypothetical protein [Bacteroidia bacterium]